MVSVVSQDERDISRIVSALRGVLNDANGLYSWTPVLTFATPGDLSVSYSTQTGKYVKIGRLIFAKLVITTSAFTWSTASGLLQITGLPFVSADDGSNTRGGTLSFGGITKANYTQFVFNIIGGAATVAMEASGSAQARANVVAADLPSGGTVDLRGSFSYYSSI